MGVTIGASGNKVIGPSEDRIGVAPTTPSAVELHIEELVLHGFPAADRFGIADAVQQELARLVAEQGMPSVMAHPVNVDRLDAGAIQVAAGARPRIIGTQLAEKLHQQFTPAQRRPHRNPGGKQR
jgi:hypothetical protein